MKYDYNKYLVARTIDSWINPYDYGTGWNYLEGIYTGYTYDATTDLFTLTNHVPYKTTNEIPKDTVAYYIGETTAVSGPYLNKVIWHPSDNSSFNIRTYTTVYSKVKGPYIHTITDDSGVYPDNGIYIEDGYWYVKIPPNPPYDLIPRAGLILNREVTNRFSWKHSNSYGDNPQSKFELVWRKVGDSIWNILSEATTRQYQDIPAFTFPLGTIEWQVRTFDQGGLVTGWSSVEVVTSGSKPEKAMWVSPTNGQRVIEAKPTFQWSSNVQTAYRLILYNAANFIIWDTGEIISQVKTIPSGVTFEDGLTYMVSVLIRNAENFWSEESKVSFTTSYSPPPKPELRLSNMGSTVRVEIFNAESTGIQPSTIRNEGYKLIDDEWVRIAKDIPVNGAFTDYTARSKHEEQYKVKAVGDNEGIQYSDIGNITISFRGMYLHDTENPALTVHHFPFDGEGKSRNWTRDHALMKFKGRKKPVRETSENEEDTVKVSLSIVGQEDLLALEKLVKSFGTLCYRDGRGRLLFGFVPSLPETDQTYGSTIDFNFIGLDYNGSV